MRANQNNSSKTRVVQQMGHPVVSTHDRAHKGGSAGSPAAPRLWQAIVLQARARFPKYPSPAASAWVHKQYVLHGGQFIQAKRK